MDNMTKIESLSVNREALTAALPEGQAPRDLGPGEVEKMFGPATTPLERLRAAGMVDESNPAEMGWRGEI